MSAVEVYHAVVGDQGKAYVEVIKWGAMTISMAMWEGHRKMAKKQAVRRLNCKAPNVRVHIGGEMMYVH